MGNFPTNPAIGTVLMLDDQPFELVGIEPHTRRDGLITQLLVWNSTCAECGEPIACRTPGMTSWLSRRCGECRKPGKPVKGKRGRKVTITVIEP